MRGYKGTHGDMTCRGFQFELGKTYKAQGEIKMCKNGFHFCENLRSVFAYYPPDYGNRFFEIEAKEPIRREHAKYVTAEITFIRELSAKEVGRTLYGDNSGYGDGYGAGDGDFGNNCGNGYGNDYGNGHGNSYYGDGYGNGYGDGDESGDGNYDRIKSNIHEILIFKEE